MWSLLVLILDDVIKTKWATFEYSKDEYLVKFITDQNNYSLVYPSHLAENSQSDWLTHRWAAMQLICIILTHRYVLARNLTARNQQNNSVKVNLAKYPLWNIPWSDKSPSAPYLPFCNVLYWCSRYPHEPQFGLINIRKHEYCSWHVACHATPVISKLIFYWPFTLDITGRFYKVTENMRKLLYREKRITRGINFHAS